MDPAQGAAVRRGTGDIAGPCAGVGQSVYRRPLAFSTTDTVARIGQTGD